MTRPDPTHLAWIDLETTGTDEANGHVLEVGMIVTGWDLTEVSRGTWYVMPPPGTTPQAIHDGCPAVVQEMHGESNLWSDYDDACADWVAGTDRADVGTPGDVAAAMARTLDRYAPQDGQQVALAGSGVGHFDGRWVRRHLPAAGRMLTYWPIDTGVMRRFLRHVVGAPIPDLAAAQGLSSHRALPDAERSLHEARLYRDAMVAADLTEDLWWCWANGTAGARPDDAEG